MARVLAYREMQKSLVSTGEEGVRNVSSGRMELGEVLVIGKALGPTVHLPGTFGWGRGTCRGIDKAGSPQSVGSIVLQHT